MPAIHTSHSIAGAKVLCAVQALEDYESDVVYPLVNRDTGFLLILTICNNTLGYPDGPETGVALRTSELSLRR